MGRHRREKWLGAALRWHIGYVRVVLAYYGFVEGDPVSMRAELVEAVNDESFTVAERREMRRRLLQLDRGDFRGVDPIQDLARDWDL